MALRLGRGPAFARIAPAILEDPPQEPLGLGIGTDLLGDFLENARGPLAVLTPLRLAARAFLAARAPVQRQRVLFAHQDTALEHRRHLAVKRDHAVPRAQRPIGKEQIHDRASLGLFQHA